MRWPWPVLWRPEVGGRKPALVALGILLVLPMLALPFPPPRLNPEDREALAHQYFDQTEIERGRAYRIAKLRVYGAELVVRIGLLALLALTALPLLRRLALKVGGQGYGVQVLVIGLLVLALLALATVPLRFYSGYFLESAYGLSTQSWKGWARDYLLARGVTWTILLLAALGLYVLIRRFPGWWWLPAGGGAWLLSAALVFLSPVVIDPLFNEFRPLEPGPLRTRLESMARSAGLEQPRIEVMDASRRTRRLNAYVTGLGGTQRIVLYDTLIQSSSPEEVALVVGHELGHWIRRHLWKGVALAGPGLLLGALLIAWLVGSPSVRGGIGLSDPADPSGIPFFLLVITLLVTFSLPLQNGISRRFEAEADRMSLELTDDPTTFIDVEVEVARRNLSDLVPPQFVIWALSTHPPTLDRIAMARAFTPERGQ